MVSAYFMLIYERPYLSVQLGLVFFVFKSHNLFTNPAYAPGNFHILGASCNHPATLVTLQAPSVASTLLLLLLVANTPLPPAPALLWLQAATDRRESVLQRRYCQRAFWNIAPAFSVSQYSVSCWEEGRTSQRLSTSSQGEWVMNYWKL